MMKGSSNETQLEEQRGGAKSKGAVDRCVVYNGTDLFSF
jgi:hypothetical protein